MKIYVVETMMDYTTQIAFSDKKEVAEALAKELTEKSFLYDYWVTAYETIENGITFFDGD
jgi:mevalonate pyrophosphate decarboxylase